MFTIQIRKNDTTVDVDFDSFPATSVEYVVRYGLTQILNDAHAPIVAKSYKPEDNEGATLSEAINARVTARLFQLMSGDVPSAKRASPTETKKRAQARKIIETVGAETLTDDELAAVIEMLQNRKLAA